MTLSILTLEPNDSGLKIGDAVPDIDANVSQDCILADKDGTHVGLFLTQLPADLLNLINTLLDLSAIEEEELKLDIASNDMAVLVRKVCQELEALAVQKEQTLTCQDLPQTLE